MSKTATSLHEALHTASIVSDMFDRHLAAHPAVEGNEALRGSAQRLSSALGEFYQQIGAAIVDDPDPGETRG